MEFLKELFGGQALTYDQLASAAKGKGLEVVNAAGGAYVQKDKLDAVSMERDNLKTQLSEASAQMEQFQDMDVEGMKQAVSSWKTKYETDTQALKDQLSAKEYEYTVSGAVSGLKFTSESAKKAFVADLTAKKLPVQEGKLLGLDDYMKQYKESDPSAFAPEGKEESVPYVVSKTSGGNMNSMVNTLRAAFGLPGKE